MRIIRDAWRHLDGSYRLTTAFPLATSEDGWAEAARRAIREAGGRWDAEGGEWIVPGDAVDRLGAHRVFVVVASGYCCGGPSRAEAREYEVRRRMLFRVFCPACGKRPAGSTLWEVPIVESCGEGEEGRLTYDAAFRSEVEG